MALIPSQTVRRISLLCEGCSILVIASENPAERNGLVCLEGSFETAVVGGVALAWRLMTQRAAVQVQMLFLG